jgi:hypothetical protein
MCDASFKGNNHVCINKLRRLLGNISTKRGLVASLAESLWLSLKANVRKAKPDALKKAFS